MVAREQQRNLHYNDLTKRSKSKKKQLITTKLQGSNEFMKSPFQQNTWQLTPKQ